MPESLTDIFESTETPCSHMAGAAQKVLSGMREGMLPLWI